METLLGDSEWAGWSDREIARRANVSNDFVSRLRPSLSLNDSENKTYTTKHGTVAQMNTANIGRSQVLTVEPERDASLADYTWQGQKWDLKKQQGLDFAIIETSPPYHDTGTAPTISSTVGAVRTQ